MKIELDKCYLNKKLKLQYHTLTYIQTLFYGQVLLTEEFNEKENTKKILPFSDDLFTNDLEEIKFEQFGQPFN